MTEFVLHLADRAAVEAPSTGGKGAALARLLQAGLPVPAGFVISTAAFEESLARVLPAIEDLLAGANDADLQGMQQVCAQVAERIVGAKIPSGVSRDIRRGLDSLGASAVSVRSSATAEDMPEASFAGQYDSFLNVRGAEAVIERMLRVWASLYSPHAVAYRRKQNIADAGMRMAVIVQRQVAADAAGVLFTRDPISGDDSRFVVNATFGLGEGVVVGHMATDHFGVDPATGDIESRNISTKSRMVALDSDGVKEVDVDAAVRDTPSLTDGRLRDLATLASGVRDLFEGAHQDIEFAVEDERVYLLQARPVTAQASEVEFVVEWEDPADANQMWLLGQIGQRVALPAKRLEQEATRKYADAARRCFDETGSPIARMQCNGCYVSGYRYIRPPDANEDEVAEKLGRFRDEVESHMDRHESWWEHVLQPGVQRVLDELGTFAPKRASLTETVAHLARAIDGYAFVLGDLHWRLAAGREDPMAWAKLYSEATGEPEIEAGKIVQAVENKTTRMVRWLRDLARLVQADATLSKIFASGDYERLPAKSVRDRPAVRTFRRRFRNFLRTYGLRNGRGFGSASNFATPTWNMAPEQPLALIASYAKQDLDELDRVEQYARRERDREIRRARRGLASEPEKLALFERALFQGWEYVRLMENHNHMMEQATMGSLREAVHWTGERFVRDGLVDNADDVFHFSLDELRDAGAGRASDLRPLVREREREFAERSRMQPPRTVGSGPPPQLPQEMMARMMPGPDAEAGRHGQIIRGTPASRGRVTGRARVAPQSDALPDVEKGDILVSENAGPNWTPVFPLISGLVLDQGAVFQHAALVAREYLIPAVILTNDATTEIRNGQTITVDGDEGIVELLD